MAKNTFGTNEWCSENCWPVDDFSLPVKEIKWMWASSVLDIVWWQWTAKSPFLSWPEQFDLEYAQEHNCQP